MACDIDFASGEVFQNRLDVYLPGLAGLDFSRRYSTLSVQEAGVLGFGWTHSLEVWAESGDTGITVHEGLEAPRVFAWDQCDGIKGPHVDEGRDRLSLSFPDRSEWIFARTAGAPARLNLLTRRDTWRNTVTRTYSGGRLDEIVDPEGRILRLHYGRDGFLDHITLAHNIHQPEPLVLARFDVNRDGDLVAVSDQGGFTEAYAYAEHLLVSCANKNGGTVHYAYDRTRRCRRTWRDDGSLNHRFDYDAEGGRTILTDSYGHRTFQVLNDAGQVAKQVDAHGNAREIAYDPEGRFIAVTDDLGAIGDSESYDPATRRLSSANGAGEASVSEFDERGRIIRRSNEAWSLTYTYNSAGQIESLTNGQGYGVRYEYDPRGRPRRVVGSDGYVVELEFDSDGLRRRLSDRDGPIEDFVFDIIGNLVRHRDARGTGRRFEYAGQDIFVSETLDDGRRTAYRHDGEGNAVAVTDPEGNTRRIGVDRFGNVVSDEDPLGHAFRYEYDLEGRLHAIVNKNGDRFELAHDAVGNEISCRFFEGDVQLAEYDSRGRRTRIIHPDGSVTSLAYDAEDRIVRLALPDATVHVLSRDGAGRVTGIATERPGDGGTDTSEMLLEYDANDAVVREQLDGHWIEHEYDPLLHPMAVRDSWGTETTYRRGGRYHLESIEEARRIFSVGWDAEGYLQELVYPNGMIQRFDIDPYGRLLQRDVRAADGELLAQRTFTYDRADRLTTAADSRDGTALYTYDRAGRLTSVTNARAAVAETYDYDANDNLIATHRGPVAVGSGDQVVASGGWAFEYDPRGRLARRVRGDEHWTFSWDGIDQLIEARRNDALVARYSYDQLGRRTRKVTADGTTSFIYDEFSNLRAERRGDVMIRYVYVPNLDVPLACHVDGEWFFYSFDQLGMPTEVWNEQGALMCRFRKEAYGTSRELVDVAATAPPFPFLLPGQYFDPETGLCYNMFRYYNPDTAGFISRDPLSIRVRENHYAYPRDPISWIDPDGLAQLTFDCKDTPKCKWSDMDCAKYVARLKLEQYRRDAAKGFRKCSKCPRSGQREYYKDKCDGSPPDTHQVDHLHDLQAGGADKCCKNLVAIPKAINNCLGSVVRRMMKEVGTRCNAGTTISSTGCSGGKCKDPAKAYIRPPKQNCADSTPKC